MKDLSMLCKIARTNRNVVAKHDNEMWILSENGFSVSRKPTPPYVRKVDIADNELKVSMMAPMRTRLGPIVKNVFDNISPCLPVPVYQMFYCKDLKFRGFLRDILDYCSEHAMCIIVKAESASNITKAIIFDVSMDKHFKQSITFYGEYYGETLQI